MEYLLKSIACLVLFLGVHRLFLQQEVLHRFNRFYLLAAVLLSFLVPLNQIEVSSPLPAQPAEQEFFQTENLPVPKVDSPTEISRSSKAEVSSPWEGAKLVFGIYVVVAIIFGIRFLRNIRLLISKIHAHIQVNYRGQTLILLPENTLPYSFLKYIFVSKEAFEREGISDAVFEHERVHVREKHSWDLIFVELLLIPFWFHPGLYWLRHAIRLNHEFIADRSAIQRTQNTEYPYELIRLAQSGTPSALVSTLNYSLTKKRIQMMTKKSKPLQVAWKLIALVPILALIYYGFSEKVIAQSDKRTSEVHIFSSGNEETEQAYDLTFYLDPTGKIYRPGQEPQQGQELSALDQWLDRLPDREVKIKMVVLKGNSTGNVAKAQAIFVNHEIRRIRLMDDSKRETREKNSSLSSQLVYGPNLQKMTKSIYYSQTKFILKYPDGELEEMSYDELPEKLQEKLPEAPGKIEPKAPTADLLESWKDGGEFALWLDGAVIENSKLNEISRDKIVHYFSSFVHDNARSERFPQNHQVHLYTLAGFEQAFGDFSDWKTKPLRGTVTLPVDKPENQSFSVNTNPVSLYQKELKAYQEKLSAGVHFIDKTSSEQEELMELFLDLGGKFFRLQAEDKKLTTRPEHPFAPFIRLKKGETYYFKRKEDLTEEEKKQLPPAPPAHKALKAQDQTTAGLLDIYQKMLLSYEFKKNELQHSLIENSPKRASFLEEYTRVQNAYWALDFAQKKRVKAPSSPSIPSRTAKGLAEC
ncbi:M56 family metallopeptidase [Algoriphagus sp.]|uniref:M56 family metallopeptidase n=1 Tax=Algoriphagus sp. TaxID=1872435 RepID=UPI002607F189|nr:M56 family metallopeptidase [Algoriphagus sp.]